jgi:class 3 adenylate cyclase
VRRLGLEVRAGGLAVHIGARVAAAVDPGQVLVSTTVKDLVAGSGLRSETAARRPSRGF